MIAAIVEGRGDQLALPRLISQAFPKVPAFRCVSLNGKSNIVRLKNGFEETVLRQRKLGSRSFLVLMDADRFFPPYSSLEEERSGMEARARRLEEEKRLKVRVCWAVLAFESWLIGGLTEGRGICGLRQRFGRVPADTQAEPQDPKLWIDRKLKRGEYSPGVQECLAANIDVDQAKQRNRSLDTFLAEFPQFVTVQRAKS